jgi:hypothetical protein
VDLNFSPDWPAWVCYLIVLFFGAFTGWREVIEKLSDTSGVWRHPTAWALVIILGVSPVLLFWLLDRVGALHDTSAIAAAIVGVAYTQILKGDSEYKAPGSTTPIWNFLSWWRDRIATNLMDRTSKNVTAFIQTVCQRLADPQVLPQAIALAQKLSSNPVAFQAELTAKRAELAGANPPIAPEVIDYKIATLVYREIYGSPNYRQLMVSYSLVDQALIDSYFSDRRSRWIALASGAAVAALVVSVIIGLDGIGTARWIEREYLISRLSKPNGTTADLDRIVSRFNDRVIAEISKPGGRAGDATFWLEPVVYVLRDSTLPMQRIDKAVQVALSTRDKDALKLQVIAERILPTLRNGNVDTRRRIQSALLYLSKGRSPVPDDKLASWNPTEGDSITDIEEKIDAWRAYWSPPKS